MHSNRTPVRSQFFLQSFRSIRLASPAMGSLDRNQKARIIPRST
jgi:hypothetical protein